MVDSVVKKIEQKMKERNYWLHSTNGNNTVLHYITPVEEKPNFCCEVYIKNEANVEFRFRYLTKKCTSLQTDFIGSFFDDGHFNKFEVDFWNLATVLYNYEKE